MMQAKNPDLPFWIDRDTGRVLLPCGFEFDGRLTQAELAASAFGQVARRFDCGTLPFMHYDVDPGVLEGLRMYGRMSFYGETLLNASVQVTYNKPGATWDDYSEELEAKAKQFHDAWLDRLFGPPHTVERLGSRTASPVEAALHTFIGYTFAWGRVDSCHDPRGGDTSIVIGYGDRRERAYEAFRRGLKRI